MRQTLNSIKKNEKVVNPIFFHTISYKQKFTKEKRNHSSTSDNLGKLRHEQWWIIKFRGPRQGFPKIDVL